MTYPATFTLDAPDTMARWRPLVQWILAIPHLFVLAAFGIVAQFCLIVSWFAIVFTGKMPAGLASLIVGYNRYNTRVTSYVGFLTDVYPPFEFPNSNDDPGGYPVATSFEPALEGRSRLTVLLRMFWMIPAYVFFYILAIAAWFVWIIAFFAILVTGKWPAGMLSFAVGFMRVSTRFTAYVSLLTDEYPPFETN